MSTVVSAAAPTWALEAVRALDHDSQMLVLHHRLGGPLDVKRGERAEWSIYDQAELEDQFEQAAMHRFLQYDDEPADEALARSAAATLAWVESKWRETWSVL